MASNLTAPSVLEKIMASRIKPQPATEFDYVFHGRREGKNTLLRGTVRAADISIPGFKSDEASRFPGGPDAYREELHRRNGTTPNPKNKSIIATPEDFERIDMPAEAVTQQEIELAALVKQYEDAFSSNPSSFTLTAPAKHTTLTGKEYKIKPFIGGEEFEAVRAYVGKKHGTLIVFKPKYPCDFEFLEVPEKQCKSVFGAAFPIYMNEVLRDVMDAKEELAAQAIKAHELERNAAAAESYSEFGSW